MKNVSSFLAGFSLLLLPATAQLPSQDSKPDSPLDSALASPYTMTHRGPHSRTWERVTWKTNSLNEASATTNSYVELANGAARLIDGQWVDCTDQLELTTTG